MNNQCQVAETLIAAGADLNAKDYVRQSLARLSLLLIVRWWVDSMAKRFFWFRAL